MTHACASVPRAGEVVALAAFLVGVCWSIVTPPLHVPHETTHFFYIQYLAENGAPPNNPKSTRVYSDEESTFLNALKFDVVVGRPDDRGVWSSLEQQRVDAAQRTRTTRDNGDALTNATSQPPIYYAL